MPGPKSGTVFIVFGREWGRVQRALGVADDTLPKRTRGVIQDEAERLADKAKSQVRKEQVVGGPAGHSGLRRRVAAGVAVKSIHGQVRVTTSMPPGQEIIPRGLDRKAGWRHPVFGRRNSWVMERPVKGGWFTNTFKEGAGEITEELEDELEQSAHRIAAAGNRRRIPGM